MIDRLISETHSFDPARARRAAMWLRLAGAATTIALAANPAFAQSLKQAGVNVFNVIYGVVGVIGAIACLLTLLNWTTGNWFGRDDPKRLFLQALFATGLAFAVVAIIQFVKDMVGGSASGISNL